MPRFPTRYGDAVWLKIYKTPLVRPVDLDELTNDNPTVVPEDAGPSRSGVALIQADPQIVFTEGRYQKQSRGRQHNAGT